MTRPGSFTAEMALQPARRKSHVNPGPDIEEPPFGWPDLVQAADRALEGLCDFIDGDLDYFALSLLVGDYRGEVLKAGLGAKAMIDGVRPPGSDSVRSGEPDG